MTRKAVILNYTKKERQQFEKLVNGAKVERRLHQRAQIILACLEKKTNLLVAGQLNISRFTASSEERFANR